MWDLLKEFAPFLTAYPLWFRIAVAAWILTGALLLVSLIFLRQSTNAGTGVPANPPSSASAATTSTPDASIATPDEYFATLRTLDDRFLQRDQFLAEALGKRVTWIGRVERVWRHPHAGSIHVFMECLKTDCPGYIVDGTPAMKAELFSLRRGDVLSATGIIENRIGLSISAESIKLVLPPSGTQ